MFNYNTRIDENKLAIYLSNIDPSTDKILVDFGDGTQQVVGTNNLSAQHIYQNPGIYSPELITSEGVFQRSDYIIVTNGLANAVDFTIEHVGPHAKDYTLHNTTTGFTPDDVHFFTTVVSDEPLEMIDGKEMTNDGEYAFIEYTTLDDINFGNLSYASIPRTYYVTMWLNTDPQLEGGASVWHDEYPYKAASYTVSGAPNPMQNPSFEAPRYPVNYNGNTSNTFTCYNSGYIFGWEYSGIGNSANMMYWLRNEKLTLPDGGTGALRFTQMDTYGSGYNVVSLYQSFDFTGLSTITTWFYYNWFNRGIGPQLATVPVIILIDNVAVGSAPLGTWTTWFSITIDVSAYTGVHQLKYSSSIPMGNWWTQWQDVIIDSITVT